MRRTRYRGLRVGLIAALGSASVSSAATALEAEPARSAREPVQVWYREGAGCPDGEAFVELLRRLGRPAALATVGGRVDFVVTLAHTAGQSSGRLERQARDRSVAIREVTAPSCDEVAEVLSLSLDLAAQPADEREPATALEAPSPAAPRQRLGAQATLESGFARSQLVGGAVFIELEPAARWDLRLLLRGAYGERDAAVAVSIGLLAARLEACWSWALAADVELAPCLGADVGLAFAESSASGGRSDAGPWSSAVAHVRGRWQLGENLALEPQIGAIAPLVNYSLTAQTGGEVTSSAIVGLQAALGFSYRL